MSAVLLASDLITNHFIIYGLTQEEQRFKIEKEKILSPEVLELENNTEIQNLMAQRSLLGEKIFALEPMINYCYEHIDQPNPIQDLVDKGFISQEFNGLTCLEVNQMNDRLQIEFMDVIKKLGNLQQQEPLNQTPNMQEGDGGVKYCSDFDVTNFKVQPGDPYDLDRDGDGIACED